MSDSDKIKKMFGFGTADQEVAESNQELAVDNEGSLQELLEKAQKSTIEWSEKYASLSADFQNYKKRTDLERIEWSLEAQKKVFLALLEVTDNFERALDGERKRKDDQTDSWLAGFEMIYQSIEKLINSFGVKEITEFAVFNPKYHEALVQVESADHESGQVVQVFQKGYLLHEKVIRPAKVSVAK